MNVAIREVREEDAEAITELLNPIIRAGRYTVMDTELSVGDQLEFIRSFPARGVFLVAIDGANGNLVGLQDVVPLAAGSRATEPVGVISTFVALSSQGHGVGRSLSGATFSRAKELGFCQLNATIRADNPAAVTFYLGQGFELVSSTPTHGDTKTRAISGTVVAERRLQ